jgi:hypothetical protein
MGGDPSFDRNPQALVALSSLLPRILPSKTFSFFTPGIAEAELRATRSISLLAPGQGFGEPSRSRDKRMGGD